MKFPADRYFNYKDKVTNRAKELVLDLILEHGIMIYVEEELSQQCIVNPIDNMPETIQFVSGLKYHIGSCSFETIGELRAALKNKAFL